MKRIYKTILGIVLIAAAAFTTANMISDIPAFKSIQKWKEIDVGFNTIELQTGTYTGNIEAKEFSGDGEYVLETGDSYAGTWVKSKPDGEGTLIIAGVGKYEGGFLDGKRSGEGAFYWDDGSYIEGEWKEDKITGYCVYTSDDFVIKGTINNRKNSFLNGEITFYYEEGELTWSFDEKKPITDRSEVTFISQDGTKITGPFTNGGFNGECRIEYENGDYYKGNLVNNIRSGSGIYHWEKGEGAFDPEYKGNWENDMMNGDGIYFYTGIPLFYNENNSLKGTFIDNRPDGECIFKRNSTELYGEWITQWRDGRCISVKEKR